MQILKPVFWFIMLLLSLTAILEAAGIVDWLDKDYKHEWTNCQQELDTCLSQHTDTLPFAGGHCDDSLRYDTVDTHNGGFAITETDFRNRVHTYEGPTPPPNLFMGALLSKKAIDAMFDGEPTANVLMCQMAKEGSETMVFRVVRSTDFGITPLMTGPAPYYFESKVHCPMDCRNILR